MTVRRRRPRSPDRADRGVVPDNAGGNTAGDAADGTGLVRIAAATRGRVTRAQQWLAKYRGIPVIDVVLGIFRRDRRAAGPVMSSALAFRLFLPLLLLTIGVAGFASDVVDARSVDRAAGIRGGVAKQVIAAFHESGLTRWVAVLLGLWGVLVAGRSLSRVLYLPARPHGGCRRATTPGSARWAVLRALPAP